MKKRLLTLAMVLGMGLFASNQAQAQGYYYPSSTQNSYGYQGNQTYSGNQGYNGGYSNNHTVLGQNINQLHQYGTYMTNNYANESRNYYGCRNSAALLAEMRRYNTYTNNLAVAYRGSCQKTYRSRCNQVRTSLSRIQTLRKSARVSPTVCQYISRSCPIATYVKTNYSYYQPRPVCNTRPVVVQRPPKSNTGHGHGRPHYSKDRGGIDVGSAVLGAVAGRIIHGIIHNH